MLAPAAPPAREAGRGWKSPAGGGSSKPFSWLSNARRQTVGRGPPTQPAPEVAPRTPSPSCGLVSKCGRLLRKRARRRETTGPASRLVSCFFLCSFAPPPPPQGSLGKKDGEIFFVLDGLFQGENLLFLKTPRPLLDHVVHPRAHQHPRPAPNELVAEIHEPRTLPRSDLPYFVKAHALVVPHELVVLVRCAWCRPECFFVDGAATKMRKRDRRRKITSQP